MNTPHSKKQVDANGLKIKYEFFDELSSEKEPEITQVIVESFKIFSKIFGGLPRNLSGQKYTDFTVHVKHDKHLSGEADPQIVMLTWSNGSAFGYGDWKTLLMHEVFHLWSAESIRYNDGGEHWFNEGFAEYYIYRTAAKLDMIYPEQVLSIAAQSIGYYMTSKGLGNISMREAGTRNKKMDNYFLVYNGGWIVAMILDHEIRSKSKGKNSLDDLMRWLYINFKRHEKLYTLENIVQGLNGVTGMDFTDFMSKYVEGKKVMPVNEYFDLGKAIWDLKYNTKKINRHEYLYKSLGVYEKIQHQSKDT